MSVPVAPLTTLRLGPVASRLITCDTTEKIVDVLRELPADDPAERTLVLAGGSNVVIADDLTDLTVVRLANTEITVYDDVVRAEAGASWDDVVVTSLAHGLGGLECLSGDSGLGRGDAGAERRCVRRGGIRHHHPGPVAGSTQWRGALGRTAEELGFGYRTSVLQAGRRTRQLPAVVLEVEFALDAERPQRAAALRGVDESALGGGRAGIRASTRQAVRGGGAGTAGPPREWCWTLRDHDTWSVGSFFTNPVVSTADYAAAERRTIDGPVPSYPANGRRQAGRRLAGRTRRFRERVTPTRTRRCPAVHQARARPHQPG